MTNEVRIEGESQIPKASGRIRRVWLEPNDAAAYPPVIQAILAADLIIIGPGSLYTSILPNILVRDLLQAISPAGRVKMFVANVATQPGETEHYSSGDHIRALEDLIGFELVDVIVCNSCYDGDLVRGSEWVRVDDAETRDARIYFTDLIDCNNAMRHDSIKLAQTLMELYNERTGPLE